MRLTFKATVAEHDDRNLSAAPDQTEFHDAALLLRLGRSEELARRQAEALNRRIEFLAWEPRPEKLLEQTLKAITEQLRGGAGTLCIYDAGAGAARCVEHVSTSGAAAVGAAHGGGAVPTSVAGEPL